MPTLPTLSLGQFSLRSSLETPLAAGQWYLGYECHSCQQPIPVVACDEKASISFGGGGTMAMVCPHCAAKHRYHLQELRKTQAPHAH